MSEREDDADHHRHGADRRDHGQPQRAGREQRVQAGEEEDAGFDHRGRVEVGAHRRGRFHRVGQPEMERELGGLRERAEQDEDKDRREKRGRHQRCRVGAEQLRDFHGARHAAEEDDAGEHGEAARTGEQQRLQGRGARPRLVVVVADEQVRRHARQLPKNEQEHEVVGAHDAHHRAHEPEQVEVEFPEILFAGQVAGRIPRHENADDRNQEQEKQRKPVHAEGQANPEGGHPRVRENDGLPSGHARNHRGESDGCSQRHEPENQTAPAAEVAVQPWREHGRDKDRSEDAGE